MMKLIDSQHCCCWIIYRRREGLGGDVNNNSKCIHRILLESTLRTHRDRLAQTFIIEILATLKNPEQRITRCDEVTNLRYQFDEAVGTLSHRDEAFANESKYNAVMFVQYDTGWIFLQALHWF